MTLLQAKSKLDKVISKARVHFYKPFQIAEILRRHRLGQIEDLSDQESYRNNSRKWRDEVSVELVGRSCTSSARYQDDVFNENACPPEALVALGKHNKATDGEVEVYIYRMFEAKAAAIARILSEIRKATPETFDLASVVKSFEKRKGLKRSLDKVFEITVYALFSTVVKALRLQVSLTIENADPNLIDLFGDFLEKLVGLKKGQTSLVLPASLFRLGSTNAADRGLDMIANFGPAIQVKHITLNHKAMADICDGITADRIVIVCKDAEASTVDAFMKQLGMEERLQAVITLSDLQRWYRICFSPAHRDTLGTLLLKNFIREFVEEFPSLDGMPKFIKKRSYGSLVLSETWAVPKID